MIKLISYLWAADDKFAERWRAHAALLREQPDVVRHVRRVVVNLALGDSDSPIDSPEQADGVGELWFDGLDELRAALAAPGWRDVLAPDLAGFADLERSGSLVARAVVAEDGPPSPVKLCAAGYRRAGLTREEAQRYWGDVHPGVVASATGYAGHVRRYVQNHPVAYDGPVIGRALDHDIALEIFFDSVPDMAAAFGEPDYLEVVRPDELRFADVNGGLALVTSESVLYEA